MAGDSTAYSTNITPGAPPLLWSNLKSAFDQINANFEVIAASLGESGITPLNFNDLDTSLSPSNTNTYSLGNSTNQWKRLYLSSWADIPGSENNGVWIGGAQIKNVGNHIDLPSDSTVNGQLIRDPSRIYFKEVQVDNNNVVVAQDGVNRLNLLSGTGIQLSVDSAAESIEIDNTGVTQLTGTPGQIGISASTGNVTLTNLGVLSLTNTTALPAGRSAGAGIHVNNSTGNISITNTGILNIVNSSPSVLFVDYDQGTGVVTIANTSPNIVQNVFTTVAVSGQLDITTSAANDTLTIEKGYGIELTTNSGTKTLNISLNPRIDINGSVFGDDSSRLVDAVSNYIYGNISATTLRTVETSIALGNNSGVTSQGVNSVAIGNSSGNTSQGNDAVAIGNGAGNTSQGSIAVAIGNLAGETSQGSAGVAIGYYAGKDTQESGAVAIGYTAAQITQRQAAVAIGWSAGQTNQGAYAIGIGYRAGFTNQHASSIILNGSGVALNSTGAGFYVNPIRSNANGTPLMYDASTSELFYSNVLEFIGSKISTIDSSSILFDSPVNFQTAVIVDSDLTVKDDLHIMGTWYGDVQDVSSTDSVVDISPTGAINSNIIYSNPLSAQDIIIPNAAAEPGKRYVISNGNGASTITLKDASANTITTIGPDSAKEVISNGFAWQAL